MKVKGIQFGNRMEMLRDGTIRMKDGTSRTEYSAAWFRIVNQNHPEHTSVPIAILTQTEYERLLLLAECNVCA